MPHKTTFWTEKYNTVVNMKLLHGFIIYRRDKEVEFVPQISLDYSRDAVTVRTVPVNAKTQRMEAISLMFFSSVSPVALSGTEERTILQ